MPGALATILSSLITVDQTEKMQAV